MLGDKRTIHSLDAIDNIHDPHQRQGVAMLEGLATFQPIVPFIRDHHFSPNHRGSREQHIVYFADAFERLLPADSHVAAWAHAGGGGTVSSLCIGRSIRRSAISCARSLKMRTSGSTFTPAIFSGCWRLLAPSTTRYLDIHGLKDVCLLIAKIVDTYSSFTATHSIMVGEIAASLPAGCSCRSPPAQQIQIAGYLHDIGKVYIPLSHSRKKRASWMMRS
ncbi:HD-GYP domain-containing protein [Klebsiella pneumoniae subsp. rhinoscleromatis]|nr:HD-GYP domain-containing protein [Klebsiella pneumoniae subsp. rhinoscleromatis]